MKKLFKILSVILVSTYSLYAGDITISGAASLKEYLEKAKSEYEKNHPDTNILINLGGSGTLKKQVLQGAPIDLIFLADKNEVLNLDKAGYIDRSADVLQNSLVIIQNKNYKGNNFIWDQNNKFIVALGNFNFVPAGKYAKEMLTKKGIWENIQEKIVFAKDVRSVLNYVELGEADFGVVYKTDAKNLKNSIVLEEVDNNLHSPIIYTLGIIKDSKDRQEVIDFYEFLKTRTEL